MFRSSLSTMALMALIGCGGDSAEKYLRQGVAHFQKQEYDLAIQSYEKAIELEPKSAAAYNLLGMAYRFKYNQLANPDFKAEGDRGLPEGRRHRSPLLGRHDQSGRHLLLPGREGQGRPLV